MTSPSNPIQGIPPPKSKWRPVVITIVSAFLLGAGSCFGAIAAGNSSISSALLAVFFASVAALLAGLIWALVTWIQK